MRRLRILALSGLALIVCMFLAACGGGGTKPAPPPSGPVIISTSPPQGAINTPYIFQLGASGGTGRYTWSIASGTLPPGLALDQSTAQVNGTPTQFGSWIFTIEVTDANNLSDEYNVTVNISGLVVVACDSCTSGFTLPPGTPGVPYSATFSVTGGQSQPPYTWCIVETSGTCDNGSQGALPPGLMLSTVNNQGIVSGTPTTPGAPTHFTIQASDSETIPAHGSAMISLTIIEITTTSLPNANLNTVYNQNVTVAGGTSPYTWSITSGSLPPGLTLCTRSTGGNCAITGTPTTLGVYNFTVQAADAETPAATASAALSIDVQGPTLKVQTTSLPAATVSLPYSSTLLATGGVPPLTWCVKEPSGGGCDNGSGGALPAGVTLNTATGAISGTPTASGKSIFVVQVSDSENPPQIALSQTPLSITVNPAITNSQLHGNFAFSLNGYDSGNPYMMAGAFVADGNGNITSGSLDRNDGSGEPIDGTTGAVTPQTMTTGSVYSLNADGTGTMTIVTNQGSYKFSLVVSGTGCTPTSSNSGCGRLIQRDSSNPQIYGSGVLKVQDSAFFQASQITPGNFALVYSGYDTAGKRYSGAGAMGTEPATQINVDCNNNGWGLQTCPMDVNDNGSPHSNPFGGTLSSTIDTNTGRGSYAQFSFPNDPNGNCLGTSGSTACSYAYYVVNAKELILISADPVTKPANLTLWSAVRQVRAPSGWTNAALLGSSVVELNAVDSSSGSGVPDITAGLFKGDGAGNATLNSDENKGGTLNLQQTSSGTYVIDPLTGRVALGGFSTQFGSTPPVLYLTAANSAVAVGTDTEATYGVLEPQAGAPFTNASVESAYAGGTAWPVISGVTNSVTAMFADGVGNINGTQITSGPAGPGGPNSLILTYLVDATGRAVVKQNGNQFGILYVVSPNKVIMLPAASTDSTPAMNGMALGPAS